MNGFLRALRAERLKLRRSLTGWAVLLGGLFVPAIMLAVRLHQPARTSAMRASGSYWRQHWLESFESIAVLILPLLLVLVTTLVTHLEHRNNTWKQLHASPLPLATLYGAKLATLLLVLAGVFAVVNGGLLLAGWIPLRWIGGGAGGAEALPVRTLLRWNGRFFLDCLPVVGIQMALALRFRNVLVPLGAGVGTWILALVAMNSRYVAAVPYGYVAVDYLIVAGHRAATSLIGPPPLLALGAFVASAAGGFSAYAWNADRGAAS